MNISENTEAIRNLLTRSRTVAVVGCSPDPRRDSHDVAAYLIAAGYAVFPVNPAVGTLLGRPCYPDLRSIPEAIDIVDIFRRPEHVPAIVEQALVVGAKAIWMQLGVGHAEAAAQAAQSGLDVVVEKCIKVAHRVLRIPRR
ncbi:MAG: CoA-binding protein [Planctomycetes bacterium]|nr:CoA-binding protein [Planctomycetota bacterium]